MTSRPWKRWIAYVLGAVVFTVLGLLLAETELGTGAKHASSELGSRAKRAAFDSVARRTDVRARNLVLMEHPSLVEAIRRGGAFGGEFSWVVAQNMFSRGEAAAGDAKEKTAIVEIAPRTWHIRLPIVNAVLFETDAGLVLVDTGMAPGGPAVLEAMRSVSDAPLHTIIYTHGHVDHAYGTWALVEAGETPEIIAHEDLVARFERYIRLRGSLAKYMSQPPEQLPRSREDLVWPTRTFRDRLEITVGGERFILQHHRGETDDQLYVWVPGRKALASADYYQGFLPNAGNGKRVQRHPEEWAVALREMAALEPAILLPAHGEAIADPATIRENLLVLAEALQTIVDHTIAGLNAGLRQDEIFRSLRLPEHLAIHRLVGRRAVPLDARAAGSAGAGDRRPRRRNRTTRGARSRRDGDGPAPGQPPGRLGLPRRPREHRSAAAGHRRLRPANPRREEQHPGDVGLPRRDGGGPAGPDRRAALEQDAALGLSSGRGRRD
jgi:glyoxylase-like metal-dependent hydrolase (beta-lactamase superfamily II)